MRNQAIKFLQIFRASKTRDQTIVDILHASQISRRDFKEGIAEIGFLMGMQYGFELALSFPPLQKIKAAFGSGFDSKWKAPKGALENMKAFNPIFNINAGIE